MDDFRAAWRADHAALSLGGLSIFEFIREGGKERFGGPIDVEALKGTLVRRPFLSFFVCVYVNFKLTC